MLDLDPYGFATYPEAEAHLKRNVSAEDGDADRIAAAMNRGVAWMEWRTRRRLKSRVHRKAVTLASCGTTLDGLTVTGSGFTALEVGDDVIGTGLAVGTRVSAIASAASMTVTRKATATGSVSLTFGSNPLVRSGEGSRDAYIQECPVTRVIGIYELDDAGTRSALDITGIRIERETGRVVLPYDTFPIGELNISIDCVAGYTEPSATTLGDWTGWSTLKAIHLRATEVFFTDAISLRGRTTETSFGNASSRIPDFAMPGDLEGSIHPFIRRWA